MHSPSLASVPAPPTTTATAATSLPSRAVTQLKNADRWLAPEFVFWLLPIAAYFVFPDNLVLLTQMAITALFCISLDLILGFAGIVSLGHAAFFGLGAYTAGLLAANGWGEPISGLLIAALVSAALGLLTSLLVLRGADLTRLMVTLGVAMMLFELANKMTWLTGGVDGLQGMEVQPVLGMFRFDMVGKTAFWYALVVLFLLFWAARKLVHSPFGLGLKGIRLNVARMPALGAPVNRRLAAVYTLGAAYAGVAGALMAQTTQFVALDVLSFNRSAELLLILVLGGSGSLYGALIGTIVFMSAHHVLSDMNPEYWQFWLGALLLAIVLFARDGVMGGLRRAGARLGLGAKA